jgi:oligopeptidase B
MHNKHVTAVVVVVALLLAGCAALPQPPLPAQRAHLVESPQGTRVDPFYWLRDDTRENPEILDHLRAENAFTEAMTARQRGLEERLFAEQRSHVAEDDQSAPVFERGWWYYSRFEKGKEHAIHARRKGTMEAPEEVLLDGNALAEGHDYFQIGYYTVSPDNQWLAWAEDTVGRREYVLRIRNLTTGEISDGGVKPIQGDLAWLDDNRSVLYTELDPQTLLGYRVRAHRRGEPMERDAVVYTERDNSFYISVGRSKSGRYVYVHCQSTEQTEQLYADAGSLPLKWRAVVPRGGKHEYSAEHLPASGGQAGDGEFVLRSNDRAPNFRLVRVPVARSADRRAWRELLAHRDDAFIEDFDVLRTHVAVGERSGGLAKLRIVPLDGRASALVDAQEPAYTMSLRTTPDIDSATLRYVYESMTTPPTTIDLDPVTGERFVRRVQPVPGGFDAADYVTEYRQAVVRDGTRVPVSLVYHRDTPLDGTAPLLQYAYGSYGLSSDPTFRANRLPLLKRGFVYAIAHVRGGQEMGRAWYENGKLLHKRNTFTDFIDVTDFLVAERIAAKDKIFAEGGSAGGLLMGAVANMAPEKYRGILAHVPFVDVVTTMLDESIPLTTNEFDEWGNPKHQPYYDYMLSYSPYDNVHYRDYPAMYITTGLWDSQVQYFEPAKWVARLRLADTSPETPVLFRVEMTAGHGGKSGRFQRLREVAQNQAFMLAQLGMRR